LGTGTEEFLIFLSTNRVKTIFTSNRTFHAPK
jgi:hypothetical protein